MKVSVIVLTYNQEQTIGRALDSVLNQQTEFDYEVILGDDASTDTTRAICEDYARRFPTRIRLMPREANKGVTRNYFDCLEAAQGEYIADCAGDDRWSSPLKLARQIEFLDRNHEVSAVHTAWHEIGPGESTTIVQDYPPIISGREMLIRLLRHDKPQPMILSTALYRKNIILDQYVGDRKRFLNAVAEDFSIMTSLCLAGNIGYIAEPMFDYSIGRTDTVSNPAKVERAAGFYVGSFEQTLQIAERAGVPLENFSPALLPYFHYALSLACKSRNRELIKRAETARQQAQLPHTLKSFVKIFLGYIQSR